MTTLTPDRVIMHPHDPISIAQPAVPRRSFLDVLLDDMSSDEREECLDFLESEARGDLNFAALKAVRACRRDVED